MTDMNKYFLKLVGNHKLADWRWRFDAADDRRAIEMSVQQLETVGACPGVAGAQLVKLRDLGDGVHEFVDVFTFEVFRRVVVKETE